MRCFGKPQGEVFAPCWQDTTLSQFRGTLSLTSLHIVPPVSHRSTGLRARVGTVCRTFMLDASLKQAVPIGIRHIFEFASSSRMAAGTSADRFAGSGSWGSPADEGCNQTTSG